jgi:uncharacterized membrane protein YfhO
VDDIPTPVLKANYLFRAITLPAGEHIVTFAYQPKLFYTGALVSGVSLIVLIVLILYWFGKKKTAVKN